ncbi:phage tail protein [Mammaliicoccus vitulinus]|uniref:phage tail protein n=1 Tax=Mammaliicoccus vitulinus TaxID=71237 RepID=UPI00331643FE
MIINLGDKRMNFDLENETPFFQSSNDNRVRFDIDSLDKKNLSDIMNRLFNNPLNTKCSFLSEYISPVKYREKTRVGRFLSITNWHEEVHSTDEKYIISTIERLKNEEIIKYSLYIQKGLVDPYIIFYNNKNMFYINNSVIDIISSSKDFITNIKEDFKDDIDTFYEVTL